MKARFPSVTIIAGQRWLEAGKVVTSAGVSAGIDMSLHLVERFAGRDLAVRTARQMEYQWQENA
jgi:transcriptional regulator GlxA family with amidase domain